MVLDNWCLNCVIMGVVFGVVVGGVVGVCYGMYEVFVYKVLGMFKV